MSTDSVVFLTRSLERGGAERQLVMLAAGLQARGVGVEVLTFYEGGPLDAELEAAGVKVRSLEKQHRWDVIRFLLRTSKELRNSNASIFYGFLPISNIILGILKPFLMGRRIVFGIRASELSLAQHDWLTRLSYRLERTLGRSADLIIANSGAGRDHAIAQGFPSERVTVIENGIDTTYFQFDSVERNRVRTEWGIAPDEIVIGVTARLDPLKGHQTFLRAAALVAEQAAKIRFVCVGGGASSYRDHLLTMAVQLGLSRRVIWAGPRADMRAVWSAFDIACSTSVSEGFSNAIAEAMACERICIVTDVGDSARIVGDTGYIIEPNDEAALAGVWRELGSAPAENRIRRGARARQRIEDLFGRDRLLDATVKALGLG